MAPEERLRASSPCCSFASRWGVVGSDTARFAHFVRGPRAALAYARATLAAPRIRHVVGHNPLGGWMVVADARAAPRCRPPPGLFADDEISTQGPLAVKVSNALVARMTRVPPVNQWVLVVAVALHVVAIAFYRLRLEADLVGPMVSRVDGGARGTLPRRSRAPLAARRAGARSRWPAACVYWLVVVYPERLIRAMTERYDPTAIALHWIVAAPHPRQPRFGLYIVGLPLSPQKLRYFS